MLPGRIYYSRISKRQCLILLHHLRKRCRQRGEQQEIDPGQSVDIQPGFVKARIAQGREGDQEPRDGLRTNLFNILQQVLQVLLRGNHSERGFRGGNLAVLRRLCQDKEQAVERLYHFQLLYQIA